MPPPPVSPQGSRAGLITATIILSILVVVSSFLWIHTLGERNQAMKIADDEKKKWAGIADPTSELVLKARDMAKQDSAGKSAFDVIEGERQNLATVISGQTTSTEDARKAAEGTIAHVNDVITSTAKKVGSDDRGLKMATSTSLTSAIGRYADETAKLMQEKKTAEENLRKLDAEKAALVTQQTAAAETQAKAIQDEQAKTAAETAKVEAYRKEMETQNGQTNQNFQKQLADVNAAMAQIQVTIQAQEQAIAKANQAREALLKRLRQYQQKATENVVRVPDGTITRLSEDGYCYINRGLGDQINVGMTFEVYDKTKGIPPLGDGLASADDDAAKRAAVVAARKGGGIVYDTELPKGKGSIEVVSVGPGSTSQCRIIRVEPGEHGPQTFNEGDLIGNLVYDPKTKYNWVVYGDFDLDRNNIATSSDTAVIRRLIEQWGARVLPIQDPTKPAASVTLDTDFVVLGVEPIVPTLSAEDEGDANIKARQQKLQDAKKAYQDVVDRAVSLGIPIMNQNRFLYYTGYYDQSRR